MKAIKNIDDALVMRFKTADNRLLYSSGTDEFKIFLGNTGIFKFDCPKKYLRKLNYFIRELDAKEIDY